MHKVIKLDTIGLGGVQGGFTGQFLRNLVLA